MKTLTQLCLFFSLMAASLASADVQFKEVYKNLKFKLPVAAVYPPDDSRLFLVEQGGRILIMPEDRKNGDAYEVFLDISGRDLIAHTFEEGLLGLAFHPDFKQNRKFYIYYTHQHPKRTILSELTTFEKTPNRANLSSERKLLEIPQPFWNHNSGNIVFGPDGMLYLAVGDGGKRDDIRRLAQNPFMLNGKVLRIDVNSRSEGHAYGIPSDNPFVGQEGVRPEIWATGLRNPWGIEYDLKTGLFWLADVGQNAMEEINLIEKVGNYGWSYREGNQKFTVRNEDPPAGTKLVDPIAVYGRPDGTSITGGVVYYGCAFPELKGQFIYGDWGTGHVWAVAYDPDKKKSNGGKMIFRNSEKGNHKQYVFKPAAFVRDPQGEILVLSWNGGIFEMTK